MASRKTQLLEDFRKNPFSPVYLATGGCFGKVELTAVCILLSAMHNGKWESTFSDLLTVQAMGNTANEEYEVAMRQYEQDSFRATEHTVTRVWFDGKKPEKPIISVLAVLAGHDEEKLVFGLRTLKADRFIELSTDFSVSPRQRFLDALVNGCQRNGFAV